MYRDIGDARMCIIVMGASGDVRARKWTTEWQAKGLAAGKPVLPCTPSARGPHQPPRGAVTRAAKDEGRRAAVTRPMAQVRRRIGGRGPPTVGRVHARRSANYTGPAAQPSSAGRRRRVGQSIARNTSG